MEAVGTVVLTVAINQAVKTIHKSERYNRFKEKAKRILFRSHKNKSSSDDNIDEESWSLMENMVISAVSGSCP